MLLFRLPTCRQSGQTTKKKFKAYPIGYVHMDITELRTAEGKQYLFVAIDRATKYIDIEWHPHMTANVTVAFLRNLQQECVFKITHILTDNGVQFSYNLLVTHLRPKDGSLHPFDQLCQELGIEHRTTQFRHPWTNGQIEITNKIIKNVRLSPNYYRSLP